MPLYPVPEVPVQALNREFLVDGKVEVTSLDIAPHGGFFIAGCSNGAVLAFDLTETSPQRNGFLLAQIRAKGMHTILKLTVKISDDCRFCFAGVIKGSSEMVAIDMSDFSLNWSKFDAQINPRGKKPLPPNMNTSLMVSSIFDFYSHSDAKLRGFGAAAYIPSEFENSTENASQRRYLLACGMGIKNVHVWQFTIQDMNDSNSVDQMITKRDEWTCIYDVASNGMTITHLGFRNSGKELLTKSANVNIRVWDLTRYIEDPTGKPNYEDISNSHDVKCLLESTPFTYGGIYEFSIVKVDKNTPKEANRNVFELPERSVPPIGNLMEEDTPVSLRRRRTMREVQDVIGTQDGLHILVLCADGGVMYYGRPASYIDNLLQSSNNNSDEEENKNNLSQSDSPLGKLVELSYLQRDLDFDQAWALRKVGSQGHVVLLHSYSMSAEKENNTTSNTNTQPNPNLQLNNPTLGLNRSNNAVISITVLPSNITKDVVSSSTPEKITGWHSTGLMYLSKPPELPSTKPEIEEIKPVQEQPLNKNLETKAPTNNLPTPSTGKKRKPTNPMDGKVENSNGASFSTPSVTSAIRRPQKISPADEALKGLPPKSATRPQVSTPIATAPTTTGVKRPLNHVQALFEAAATPTPPTPTLTFVEGIATRKMPLFEVSVDEPKVYDTITIRPPPKVMKIDVSDAIHPSITTNESNQFENVKTKFNSFIINKVQTYPFPESCLSFTPSSLGTYTSQCLERMNQEQDALKEMLLQEIESNLLQNKSFSSSFTRKLFTTFNNSKTDLLRRQLFDIQGAFNRDCIANGEFKKINCPIRQVLFRFEEMPKLIENFLSHDL